MYARKTAKIYILQSVVSKMTIFAHMVTNFAHYYRKNVVILHPICIVRLAHVCKGEKNILSRLVVKL